MHPPIEQLLDLPPSADVRQHLEQCLRCRNELEGVERLRQRLRTLPQLEPVGVSWADVQSKLHTKPSARLRFAYVAAASMAALAVLVALRTTPGDSSERASASGPAESQMNAELSSLMERSRHLDLMLQGLPNRPRVERVAMAATLDTIEDRIQWLDVQLSYGAALETDEGETHTLWRERVELMDSLVKVRYAQAGSVSF